ncbi:anti-sigma factor domain-containing protein [Egicoccus sp. AB-alg6-2]|uniref:anti-sigma factor n=1 Tax=Egicoccus sp. AB-alg6-2 TaxID=3242692 RepID=UPI00359CCEA0
MTADIHTLTGAYAVDALDDDERAFFERHLQDCDACALEVRELQATAARLGGAAAETPPPGLKARVMADVDAIRQERRPAGDRRQGAPWWGRVLAPAAAVLLVLAVAAGVLAGGLYGRVSSLEETQSRYTELLAAPDVQMVETRGADGSMGRVVLAVSRGEAMFMVDGMEPAPHEHVYELWLIGEADAQPAGLFDVDEDGRVTHLLSGDFAEAAAIGVTVEPAGGSPAPTSDPVMVLELGT